MSETFLQAYGLFLAQMVTLLILFGLFVVILFRAVAETRNRSTGHFTIRALDREASLLATHGVPDLLGKAQLKQKRKAAKQKAKEKRPTVFVIDFHGDVKASGTSRLAEEVNGILDLAQEGDQVVLRLESPGGSVAGYGLAASHLVRLKEKGLRLTVAVDQVAASGGYLMAVVAEQIWAAPFGVIGSIGVVASMPNFKRFLDDKKVDFEQITAGEYKRTLTLFGENTDQDRAKVQEEVDLIHQQFKDWVSRFRPQLDLVKVATGEWWQGQKALELDLIDCLGTSDQLLMDLAQQYRLYSIRWTPAPVKRGWLSKLTAQIRAFGVGVSS